MNILITGANGQLGNEMRLVSKASSHTFVFTDVVEAEGVETIWKLYAVSYGNGACSAS